MHVQCPQCETVFRVSRADLMRADGLVRCGQCLTVFDGLQAVTDAQETSSPQLPLVAEPDDLDVELEAAPPPPAADTPQEDRADASPEAVAAAPAAARRGAVPAAIPSVPRALADDLAAPRPRARRGATTLWTLLALGLIATLAGQYVWSERERLYAYPELQPWVQGYCDVLGCSLPPRRDLARIELLSRNVFSHPNVGDALMITATLVNQAPFAQPYPDLELSLSDMQGRTVGMRRFHPPEYLQRELPADAMMEPGVPVVVSLEIVDPGSHALAFEFEFL